LIVHISGTVGRRPAFLGTALIAGIFGICLGALSSFHSVLVVVAFIGFGIGGNIPIDTTSKPVTCSLSFSIITPTQSHRGIPARGIHIAVHSLRIISNLIARSGLVLFTPFFNRSVS
jgi:hypothetical protein